MKRFGLVGFLASIYLAHRRLWTIIEETTSLETTLITAFLQTLTQMSPGAS